MQLLLDLHKEARLSLVMITHMLNLISNYAHKLIIIHRENQTVKIGDTETLLTNATLKEIYQLDIDAHLLHGHKYFFVHRHSDHDHPDRKGDHEHGGQGITNMLESIPIIGRILLAENGGMTFWEALPILQSGVVASIMVALLAGYLGIYVILKRIVFVSAALSQISSLGIAFFFLGSALLGSSVSAGLLHDETGILNGPLLSSLLFGCVTASILAVQVGEKKLTRESILGIGYALPAGLVF